jgi:phospholipid/cholesterol/gamma-HCH transport system permease protein
MSSLEFATRRLDALGDRVIRGGRAAADALYLLGNTLSFEDGLRRGPVRFFYRTAVQQLYFTAVQSLALILVMGTVVGVLAVLPLFSFGVSDLGLFTSVVNIVSHELAPLLVVIIVIGRSGTAITAELGDMQSNHAVDSLSAMGIDPLRFLVLPRLVAMVGALWILTFWFDVGVAFGSWFFVSLHRHVGLASFFDEVLSHTRHGDVVLTAFLDLVYGVAIGLVHCAFGFASRTRNDVARNLPRSFVTSLVVTLFVTLVFSIVRNG